MLTDQVLGTDPPDFWPIWETQCRNKRKKQRGQATLFLTEHILLRHQPNKNTSFSLRLAHALFLCVCLSKKSQMIGNLPVQYRSAIACADSVSITILRCCPSPVGFPHQIPISCVSPSTRGSGDRLRRAGSGESPDPPVDASTPTPIRTVSDERPHARRQRRSIRCGPRPRIPAGGSPLPVAPAARLLTRRHDRDSRRPAPHPPPRHGRHGGDARAAACRGHISHPAGTDALGTSGAPSTAAIAAPQAPWGGAPGGGSHPSPTPPRDGRPVPPPQERPPRTAVAARMSRWRGPFPLTASPLPTLGPLQQQRHGTRRGCRNRPADVWAAVPASRRGGGKGPGVGAPAASSATAAVTVSSPPRGGGRHCRRHRARRCGCQCEVSRWSHRAQPRSRRAGGAVDEALAARGVRYLDLTQVLAHQIACVLSANRRDRTPSLADVGHLHELPSSLVFVGALPYTVALRHIRRDGASASRLHCCPSRRRWPVPMTRPSHLARPILQFGPWQRQRNQNSLPHARVRAQSGRPSSWCSGAVRGLFSRHHGGRAPFTLGETKSPHRTTATAIGCRAAG